MSSGAALQELANNLSSLLTLTISGPPNVRVGSTLCWSFLIANRSQTRSLRLSIKPLFGANGISHKSSEAVVAPSLMPLTPDLRIGPLPAGASATAEMRFLVLRSGVLKVDAVQVVDLDHASQESGLLGDDDHVDLVGAFLPDIVALD